MIKEELLDVNYYLDKLSMYFKNCYGIQEQFEMITNILKITDTELEKVFECFDVMSPNILNYINSYDETGSSSDILDKIASIYGVSRSFSVTYSTISQPTPHTENLTLSNYEMIVLIRARIIQNTFRGSYEEWMIFYNLIDFGNKIVVLNDSSNATCNLFLKPSSVITNNIKYMFLAGLLSLKSLGITYRFDEYDVTRLGLWDVTNWDSEAKLWY